MSETAIIIVNYRTPWHLDKCLRSIFKFSDNFHLFLVHNSPDADSLKLGEKYVQKYPDQVTVKVHEQNLGLVGGVNSVYDEAIKYDRICFVNSDVIVTKDWLVELHRAFDENPKAVQVSPDTNAFYADPLLWKLAKKLPGKLKELANLQIYFGPPSAGNQDGFSHAPYFWLFPGGFCNLVKAEPFRGRGYFWDPNIVHGYWDDFDTTYYLRQFGEVGATNKSYVYHFLNVSFNKFDNSKAELKQRLMLLNGLYVMDKWKDRLRADLESLDKETLMRHYDNYVLRWVLTYFGLLETKPELADYIQSLPAKEVGAKFLN